MSVTIREILELFVIPVLSAGVWILWDLNKSVNNLNVKVGTLIANTHASEKRMDSLEKRIENLEDRNNRQ